MIRPALLSLMLAAPVGAEGLAGQALCEAVWDDLRRVLGEEQLTGRMRWYSDEWCVIEDVIFRGEDRLGSDLYIDRMRFQGPAFAWALDGKTSPDRMRLEIEGLRQFAQTGDPRLDWLLAAQAKPNLINARLAISWDAGDEELRIEQLSVDFPGDNFVELRAHVSGLELLPVDAFYDHLERMSVREAELTVRTHGFFEDYLLMALGSAVLPEGGDIEIAVDQLRGKLDELIDGVDRENLPAESRAAAKTFLSELPNPSGTLNLRFRGDIGVNLSLAFFAWAWDMDAKVVLSAGLADTIVEIGWTHEDTP